MTAAWRPAILGVDQPQGWALLAPTRPGAIGPIQLCAHGRATTTRTRWAVLQRCLELRAVRTAGLVMVLEDHSGVPLTKGTKAQRARRRDEDDDDSVIRSTETILGMGGGKAGWYVLAELLGIPWTSVEPKVWRPQACGIPAGTRRDAAKLKMQDWARMVMGLRGDVSHDECEALGIARWAIDAPQVAELAPGPRPVLELDKATPWAAFKAASKR